MRKILASKDISLFIKHSKLNKVEIYSFFPIDKADCECRQMIIDWQKKLAELPEKERQSLIKKTGYLTCPKSKVGMSRYVITCDNCGEVMGYCWAKDKTLKDWCDFHYVQWTDGKQWYGCFTPHISPVTEQLCLECCCGQDTRDFRVNMTISSKLADKIEKVNALGREFGTSQSKFKTRIVSKNVIPFIKEI